MKIKSLLTVAALTLTPIISAPLHAEQSAVVSKAKKIKPYPLKKCVVSDEELGSMGDYIRFVYRGQEMKVCCKPCIKKFKKNPKKYIKILAEEVSKQKKKK